MSLLLIALSPLISLRQAVKNADRRREESGHLGRPRGLLVALRKKPARVTGRAGGTDGATQPRRYPSLASEASIILQTASWSAESLSSDGTHCSVTTGRGRLNCIFSSSSWTCLGPSGAQP